MDNIVNRKLGNKESVDVVVSDLTYINITGKWNYICVLINLHNRETIGYSAGKHKNTQLVYDAFLKAKWNLNLIIIFSIHLFM